MSHIPPLLPLATTVNRLRGSGKPHLAAGLAHLAREAVTGCPFAAIICGLQAAELRHGAGIATACQSSGSTAARAAVLVTIHGSNFVGVTAVHLGHKKATHVRVVSATKITVTAPPGTGTVAVTVSATGGTSSATAGSHYRY
jgi:hypothetical protein